MPYIGNTPTTQSFSSGTDYFNGNASQTAFTLSRPVASINDVQVTVNNVVQAPNSGYTISGNTLTFDAAPSIGTNNVYVRYLSTTTQVITPSQNSVSYNSLNTDMQQDIGASFKNRIINGDMRINQRSFSGNAVEFGYTLDRWITFVGGANLWSVSQNAGSVTPPDGFTNYLGVTSLAATTPDSGHRNLVCQMIEGYNMADWNWGYSSAKPITLSFWVRSSLIGTFGATINSTSQDVAATFSYTINAANTWEYKTITVQGPTTNPGQWNTTNGRGLWLFFDMGTGANFAQNTTWGAAAKYTIGSSRTNVIGTNGATWYITGVQLEKGSTATSFDNRAFGTELALCQRYYLSTLQETFPAHLHTLGTGNYVTHGIYSFPVEMRSNPTVALFAYHLDSGGSNVGDGRNGMKRYIAGGTINYFTHTFGYGVRSTRKGIVAVNMGENTTNNEHYAAGFTATSEL